MKQIALVTGGTGGIGTKICQALTTAGYQVIACYFKNGVHQQAQQWQQQQAELGFHIDINYADLKKFEDTESLVQQVNEKYSRIDVLVNNAGITMDSSFKKMTPAQWQAVIDNNLNSVFNMTRNVLPIMLQQQYGRIINISSINGHKGQFGQCNYASTKAAMYGFSKSLALEVASKGITVNSISPGYTETEMLSTLSTEILDKIVSQIPIGRLVKPEEIARAVTFLSDTKSGSITGADLSINGGQYM